jgi:hypothetical protein
MLNSIVSERERIERYWDARSKEGELNYALFVFATRCLAEGDVEALRKIGFGPEDIPVLDQLRIADLHALTASRANAVNVSVDRAAFQHLIDHIYRRRTRERLKRELLRLDAPLPMMSALFGMNPRQYTALRDSIGITIGIGRPTSLLEADAEARLWRLWVLFADVNNPVRLRHDDLWLIVGRELPTDLRSCWFAIQQWSQDAVSLKTLDANRTALRDNELVTEEGALRERHSVTPYDIAVAPYESALAESTMRSTSTHW